MDEDASTDAVETAPQLKKSRQDLIRELKEKRGQGKPAEDKVTDAGIEEAKKAGKFKPIGFKPIGGGSEGKKRKKEKEGREKKKKKRKVEEIEDKPVKASGSMQSSVPPVPATLPEKGEQPAPESELLDPDFDIFAGVGEYAGEIEDEEDGDKHSAAEDTQEPPQEVDHPRRGWFEEPESPTPPKEPTPPPAEEPSGVEGEEVEGEPALIRLAPLASSMSVKDILAIDDAATKEEKRKARKEKKKKKAELSAEGKANRDYQKCVLCFLVLRVWEIHLDFAGLWPMSRKNPNRGAAV